MEEIYKTKTNNAILISQRSQINVLIISNNEDKMEVN